MKIYVKYMVSYRCKLIVQQELQKLGIQYLSIELGIIETKENITPQLKQALKLNLAKTGLELIEDQRAILINKIKTLIIEMIHHSDDAPILNNSNYLADNLGYDYNYLSNLFSEVKGITIQQFIILHKIEKAKELIFYNELNLNEIAFKLHYSSAAHLSNQFKKVTGLSPRYFKELGSKRKSYLENL